MHHEVDAAIACELEILPHARWSWPRTLAIIFAVWAFEWTSITCWFHTPPLPDGDHIYRVNE